MTNRQELINELETLIFGTDSERCRTRVVELAETLGKDMLTELRNEAWDLNRQKNLQTNQETAKGCGKCRNLVETGQNPTRLHCNTGALDRSINCPDFNKK